MTIGKVKFSQLPAQAESDLDPNTIFAVVNLGVSKKASLTNVKNYLLQDGFATRSYVDNLINNLIGDAPDLLNTLNELADAINNDANFYGTITQMINDTLVEIFPTKTTDDLAEGINNLYYKQERVLNSFSVNDPTETLTYDPIHGLFTFNAFAGGLVTTVNGETGNVVLDTDDIPEATNLYFTDQRARASLSAGTGVLYDNATGTISLPQAVGPNNSVTFLNLSVTNNVSVTKNITIVGNSTVNGDSTVIGDSTIGGDLSLTGDMLTQLRITNQTQSINKDSGALIVEGGVGIEKDLNVGGNITASAITTGVITHQGIVPTEGTNIDQIKTYTVNLRLLTDWQDTGINNTNLATGTYLVQVYANDVGSGGTNNNEYYSGVMSWYQGTTGSSQIMPTDEVPLHRAGGSSDGNLYLRTFRTAAGNPTNLKLQIYSNFESASAANYVFKFRRVI